MAGAIVCLRRHFGSEQGDAERDARRRLRRRPSLRRGFCEQKGPAAPRCRCRCTMTSFRCAEWHDEVSTSLHALRLAHVRWETLREYITLPHAATHTWQGSTLHAPGLPAEASSWCAPAQTLSSPLMRARPVLADYGVQLREGCCSAGACRSGAHGSRRVFQSRDSSSNLAVGCLRSCRTAHAIARDCQMLRQ